MLHMKAAAHCICCTFKINVLPLYKQNEILKLTLT